jgi:ABC-type lipoprotein export system ATPase subunit
MSLRLCSNSGAGIFVSFDGPSGAGKTTIVHHLAQLLVAQGGTCLRHGRTIRRPDREPVSRADRIRCNQPAT